MASIEQLIANPMVANLAEARSLGIEQTLGHEAAKLEILDRRLKYREALRDVENRALERQMKNKELSFNLANQDELLTAGLDKTRVELRDPVLDDVARDVPFVIDDASYSTFLDKHKNTLPQLKELFGPDGKPKPFRDALPALHNYRKQRMYNIEHQRDLELAQTRAAGLNPQYTPPKIDPRQQDAAITITDKHTKDKKYDLSDDDHRRLEYTVAYLTQQINAARADKGLKTNEDDVRDKILKLTDNYITDDRYKMGKIKLGIPFVSETKINWEELNKALNAEFEIDVPAINSTGSVSGPAALTVPTFDTEEEAAAAGLEPGTKIMVGGRPATWQ